MQCVGYVYARLEEKLGLSPDFSSGAGAKDIPGNAPNGKTRTAIDGTVYTIEVYKNDNGNHITANSWVSFGPGSSKYGHVIYVEEVIGDTIYYTESGTSMWKKGTTGTLKKKSKSDFITNCSSGGTYVGTVVFRGSGGETYTPTPSEPAGILLSSSTINLDYPNSATQTITATATGNLPNKYKLEISINSGLNHNWASSWSGNSINLTISANQNSPSSSTATIYLKDSANDSVYASANLNINVTKSVVKEYITVSFDSMGGSTKFANQTVEQYGTVTLPDRIPNRTGYTFRGWTTSPDATSNLYKNSETISVGSKDLIVYAVWEKQISKEEWDLSLSEDELFFEKNYWTGQSVIISYYEPAGMQENVDYHLRIYIDDALNSSWGDEWYDENGYKNQELIIYTPVEEIDEEEIRIELREQDNVHTLIDSASFYIYLEDTDADIFSDRNETGISVYLNGEKLSFDVQPQIINSRTMVPMRKIFEALGATVGWNNNTQTAFGVRKADDVRISIGAQYMTCNNEQKMLDSPAIVINGRTLVPVRAIAESFNCDVEWYDYGTSQVVDINMQDTINNMENKAGLVIGYSEFPPFSYYDDYGYLIGFDTELAKYVCDFWGWDYSFVEIPFDMSFSAIESGEIDCYWNAVTRTEEREEYATFTNDYFKYVYETEEDGEWYTSYETYSVPFKKEDYDTVQLVNIALEEAIKDGTIEHLITKYDME